MYVGDVADAVMAAVAQPDATGGTFELGGPQVLTMREILAWILRTTHHDKSLVALPIGLVRLQARLGEMLPGKPLTRDQLLLLQRDNVVTTGMPGLAALGSRPPRSIWWCRTTWCASSLAAVVATCQHWSRNGPNFARIPGWLGSPA